MGWLKEHRGQDGKKQFYAIYRDLQGRERSAGTFPSERAANKAWQDAESQQERGRVGDPKRGKQQFRTYVLEEWFPQHQIEASTREGYDYLLERYILPEFGAMPMREILPSHVRAWVLRLQSEGPRPPTIRNSKIILGAILTTALNDQITFLHAGRGVKTPPVARKPRRIVTVEEFDRLYAALPEGTMRLLVETDIESGLRWGELTELRVKDLDQSTGIITVARVVVNLRSRKTPDDRRFLIKQYPKAGEWRQVKVADAQLEPHHRVMPVAVVPARRLWPEVKDVPIVHRGDAATSQGLHAVLESLAEPVSCRRSVVHESHLPSLWASSDQ